MTSDTVSGEPSTPDPTILTEGEAKAFRDNVANQDKLFRNLGAIEMTLADFTSQKGRVVQAIAAVSAKNQELLKGALIARGVAESDLEKWSVEVATGLLKLKG